MKKVALMIALLGFAVVGNSVFGQDVPPSKKEKKPELSIEEKADKRTEKMTKELGLSEEQAKKVKALNMEHIQKMEETRAKMEAAKKEAHQNREEHEAALKTILTPEQAARLDEIKAEQKEKRAEKQKHAPHHD